MKARFLTAAAVLGLIVCGAGAAALRTAAPRLPTRFLVTTQSRLGSKPARLEIVAQNGRVLRVVAKQAGAAALSPNHKLIAWIGKGGIHVANARGAKSRLVLRIRCPASAKGGPEIVVCGGPFVWSPDSGKLLLVKSNRGLGVLSIKSRRVHQVVAPRKHVTYDPIAWSGPANEILYTAADNGRPNGIGCCSMKLVIALPSGALRRTLYSASEAIHDAPAASWSPSGKWIGFTTDGRARKDPRLAIIAAATGVKKRIPSFDGYTAKPVWAPDSSRFVVGSHDSPAQVFTPEGKKAGSLGQTGSVPAFWTRAGTYFWPGGTEFPRQLRVIPSGQHRARTVLRVPNGQILLTVQPIG